MKDWLDRLSSRFWIVRSKWTGVAVAASFIGWVTLNNSGRPVGLVPMVILCLLIRVLADFTSFSAKRRRALAKKQHSAPGLGTMLGLWNEAGYRMDYAATQTKETFLTNGFVTRSKTAPKTYDVKANTDNDLTALVAPGAAVVKGDAIDRLMALAPAIKNNVGCTDVTVTPTGNGNAIIKYLWSDPLGRELPVAAMPKCGPGEVGFGTWDDSTPASLEMGMHALVGGKTKMGKSSLLWALIADLVRKGIKVDLHVIDPKGGSEFFDMVPHVGVRHGGLLIATYASSGDEESIRVLDPVVNDMKTRMAENTANGIRKWKPEMSDEQPLTILIIDECLEVFETWANHKGPRDTVKGGAMTRLTKVLLSQGRAAGFMVIGLTQTAEVNALGSGVRRMFPVRLALGTDNADATNMILGDRASENGALSHRVLTPGVGYAMHEAERGYRKFRAAWCTDEDRARIAAGELPDGMPALNSESPQRYYNYSFYTSDMQPLRTGITNNFERRKSEYARDYERERAAIEAGRLDPARALHQWWPYHDLSKTRITEAAGFAEAKRIESEIIADGVWRYNHQENMNNPLRNVPPPQPEPKPSRWHRTPKPAPERPEFVRADPLPEVETPANVRPIRRTRPDITVTTTRRRRAS